jgi:hypothetical protein
MSDTASPTEKQAPAEIIAGRIESWLRVGLGRHYVAEAVIKSLGMAGYVIVPREPTEAMLENREIARITIAAARAIHSSELPCAAIWRAMVEAAGR